MPIRSKFKPKPNSFVTAVQLDLDTEGFVYNKWGGRQACKRGDWLVDNNGDKYTVTEEAFPRTYKWVSPGVYTKSAPVWAEVADKPTGPDGGQLVNSFLQSMAHPEMFGGGDCVSFADQSLAKVGVYAVRQNPILFYNLLAALEGREMKTFMPQKDYMLIFNMGNGRGILWKKNFVYEGRLAFLLKDYIDRKFMKKFQVAGEADEQE